MRSLGPRILWAIACVSTRTHLQQDKWDIWIQMCSGRILYTRDMANCLAFFTT